MADENRGDEASAETDTEHMTKAQLQRRMEETRESISQTVEEIKETVTEQYETVRETVSGVLDYREQFQKDPLVWSVGALSAGFALGYTLGYAHKSADAAGRRHSPLAAFADSLVDELSVMGRSLVMPTLNSKIRELFGFDFSDLLDEIGHLKQDQPKQITAGSSRTKKGGAKKGAKKDAKRTVKQSAGKSTGKSGGKKRSTKKGGARKSDK